MKSKDRDLKIKFLRGVSVVRPSLVGSFKKETMEIGIEEYGLDFSKKES